MKAIRNKTNAPLRVPLGGGKFLHLGPAQSGNVADSALKGAAFIKLVKAGSIAVEGEDGHSNAAAAPASSPRAYSQGHTQPTKVFPSGNRGG